MFITMTSNQRISLLFNFLVCAARTFALHDVNGLISYQHIDQVYLNHLIVKRDIPETSSLKQLDANAILLENNFEEKFFHERKLNQSSKIDHHKYYKSHSIKSENASEIYWVDLEKFTKDIVIVHDSLSNAHRRAQTVNLKFSFPFYGHILNNVTIATGGFLFTGSFLHKWLAATQYIAPLMANFDTSVSENSVLKYADNGTSLTVQWQNVVLQDDPSSGTFTFQVTINNKGDIIFAYKEIPIKITAIKDERHPVKVGLSDAYIVEKNIFYMRKKTIYEYHKIKKTHEVHNRSVIIFKPLDLCISMHTCEHCLSGAVSFQCHWCPNSNRCSDGLDRYRQDWLENGCVENSVMSFDKCAHLPDFPNNRKGAHASPVGYPFISSEISANAKSSGSSVVVTILFILALIGFILGWVAYAYFNPHTKSGQFLIKYRPSAWSCRRGHARYTAATMHSIHM